MSHRSSQPAARVYVGNLPHDVTEREVEDLFYKFGHIRDIEIKKSRNQDGAYAFVLYDDKRSVEDAIDRRDGIRFGHNYLRVERGGERRNPRRREGDREGFGPPRRSSYRVRVTGLPTTCSWQDLKDYMRRAGDVGYANVENGVGVVEYAHRDDMEHAIKTLDRTVFANIFNKTEIRVEQDFVGEDSYRRRDRRRSRSRGRRSNSSRRSGSRYSAARKSFSPKSDRRSQNSGRGRRSTASQSRHRDSVESEHGRHKSNSVHSTSEQRNGVYHRSRSTSRRKSP